MNRLALGTLITLLLSTEAQASCNVLALAEGTGAALAGLAIGSCKSSGSLTWTCTGKDGSFAIVLAQPTSTNAFGQPVTVDALAFVCLNPLGCTYAAASCSCAAGCNWEALSKGPFNGR